MKVLEEIQKELENFYQAPTGINILDFTRVEENFEKKGQLFVRNAEEDIELALILDRDILEAWNARPQNASVCFEESSHFVYLSHNHLRNRSVCPIEMEIQSEIDRLYLSYHSPLKLSPHHSEELYQSFLKRPYENRNYEEARKIARRFVHNLSGKSPHAWSDQEMKKLRKFFHSDLSEKIHLSRTSKG